MLTLRDGLRSGVVLGLSHLHSREWGTSGLVTGGLRGLTLADGVAICQEGVAVSIPLSLSVLVGQIQYGWKGTASEGQVGAHHSTGPATERQPHLMNTRLPLLSGGIHNTVNYAQTFYSHFQMRHNAIAVNRKANTLAFVMCMQYDKNGH